MRSACALGRLAPNGRDFSPVLDQSSVGVKQQLRVVDCAAIALVDADAGDDLGLAASMADLPGYIAWHSDGFFKQQQVLLTHGKWRLHERKIGVVRHHGFRENRKLHAFFSQLKQLTAEFIDGGLT
jgi:hypothetical protein